VVDALAANPPDVNGALENLADRVVVSFARKVTPAPAR
jgi:hypothetical protein